MKSNISVQDPLQPGYTYKRVRKLGTDLDPEFTPDLAPAQMHELGVFGGAYFKGWTDEYPASWFVVAPQDEVADINRNFFSNQSKFAARSLAAKRLATRR